MWKGVAPSLMPTDHHRNAAHKAAQQQEDRLNHEKLIQKTIESVQSRELKSYGVAMKQTGICAYSNMKCTHLLDGCCSSQSQLLQIMGQAIMRARWLLVLRDNFLRLNKSSL